MKRRWQVLRSPFAGSLRFRLFLLILLPLVAVALLAAAVRFWQAQSMSQGLYDDALKVVAHAVAREVIITQGDVVSDALLDSLVGVLGDPIFYNVSAADGRILAGYTDIPDNVVPSDLPSGVPQFFDFTYNGQAVRAVAMREFIADPFFDGWTTVLVWQTTSQRRALSLTILQQALAILVVVLATAAAAVWFGISKGLRPLIDLREAIALRSPSELGPIKRAVPSEVRPLVSTMNALFARLASELQRRNAFIANAAHQIRNPVAAIRAQSEAALSTKDDAQRAARLHDIHIAANDLSRLSQQLLSLETADHAPARRPETIDFTALVADMARKFAPDALAQGVDIVLDAPETRLETKGNAVMLREAVENLLDNALRYGSVNGGELRVSLSCDAGTITMMVDDDGPGIPKDASEKVFERFLRLHPSDGAEGGVAGCGLGLAIVRAIVEAHGGTVQIGQKDAGCRVILRLPNAEK